MSDGSGARCASTRRQRKIHPGTVGSGIGGIVACLSAAVEKGTGKDSETMQRLPSIGACSVGALPYTSSPHSG